MRTSKRVRADLILLFVALLWGSAFAAQRFAAINMDVHLFNGARYLLAAILLLPLARGGLAGLNRPGILGIGLAGAVLFSGAALQQIGLQTTTAGNAGFITGLYVVLIPLILAIGWRQPLRRSIWGAVVLAAAGLFFLSTGGRMELARGDVIEFGGAILWALHVILIGKLVRRVNLMHLAIGQNVVCGLLSLLAFLFLGVGGSWEGLGASRWAIVYTGVFSIAIGYTLQAVGQREAPPADAAIILSGESVFAAFFGWILLGEILSWVQLFGCGLIIAAMILAQVGNLLPAQREQAVQHF